MTPAAGPDRKSRTGRCRAMRGGADAAARLHDLQRRPDAVVRQVLLHALEIAADHRLDVGIERRHAGALVLAEGRVDLGGQRDHDLRMALGDDLAGPPLVRRIEEREQVADRDRFDALGGQLVDRVRRPSSRPAATRTSPLAVRRSRTSLRNAPGARNTGVSGLRREVVHRVPHLAADLEHVLEAGGREQADLRALAPRSRRWWRPSCRARSGRSRPATPAIRAACTPSRPSRRRSDCAASSGS